MEYIYLHLVGVYGKFVSKCSIHGAFGFVFDLFGAFVKLWWFVFLLPYAALFSSASLKEYNLVMNQIQFLRNGHSKHEPLEKASYWDLCLDFIGVLHALGIRSYCHDEVRGVQSPSKRIVFPFHETILRRWVRIAKEASSSIFFSFLIIPWKSYTWKMKFPFCTGSIFFCNVTFLHFREGELFLGSPTAVLPIRAWSRRPQVGFTQQGFWSWAEESCTAAPPRFGKYPIIHS